MNNPFIAGTSRKVFRPVLISCCRCGTWIGTTLGLCERCDWPGLRLMDWCRKVVKKQDKVCQLN